MRRAFGLPDSQGPLFAVVSRLVHQKGLDLTCEVAPQIVAAGGQIVVIGGGEPQIEQQVAALARRYPGHVGAHIGFDEALARAMFAGADFLLMPSRFEPCGLSQMYAQRFGCLPIAHATGGPDRHRRRRCHRLPVPRRQRRRPAPLPAARVPHLPPAQPARGDAARGDAAPSGWDVAGNQYLALYRRTSVELT